MPVKRLFIGGPDHDTFQIIEEDSPQWVVSHFVRPPLDEIIDPFGFHYPFNFKDEIRHTYFGKHVELFRGCRRVDNEAQPFLVRVLRTAAYVHQSLPHDYEIPLKLMYKALSTGRDHEYLSDHDPRRKEKQ